MILSDLFDESKFFRGVFGVIAFVPRLCACFVVVWFPRVVFVGFFSECKKC